MNKDVEINCKASQDPGEFKDPADLKGHDGRNLAVHLNIIENGPAFLQLWRQTAGRIMNAIDVGWS